MSETLQKLIKAQFSAIEISILFSDVVVLKNLNAIRYNKTWVPT
jgi:hypothetical protein